ncbi:MAG: hypothetical protein RL885_25300, partial [Planctomycetota bacterium]
MSAKQTPKVELDGAALVITVPMTLRRRSGRKEVHVPLGLPRAGKAKEKPSALALAVARAYRWQELLEAGEYRSTTELAEALGVDRAYVSRTLRLTSVAPWLVERIVLGDEPEGVTLAEFVRDVPEFWTVS